MKAPLILSLSILLFGTATTTSTDDAGISDGATVQPLPPSMQPEAVNQTQGPSIQVVGNSDGPPIRFKSEEAPKTLLQQPAFLGAVVSALALIVTTIVSLMSLWLSDRNNRRTLLLRTREEKVKRLQDCLRNFLAPLQHLLGTSYALYVDFKGKRGDEFRTLTYLVENREDKNKGLNTNDRLLLVEILRVSRKIESLIDREYSALRNDKLRDALSQLIAHYRLMRLAFKGKIEKEAERTFKNHVFPTRLSELLKEEIDATLADINRIEDLVDDNGAVKPRSAKTPVAPPKVPVPPAALPPEASRPSEERK